MKIKKVECVSMVYPLGEPIYNGVGKCSQRQLFLVRICTDSGLVELGEAAVYGRPVQSTLTVLEQEIAPMLIGEDPKDVGHIWHKCFSARFQHGRLGVLISALPGVDIALWGLLGKSVLTPLYRLLEGFKGSAPVYGSGGFCMGNRRTRELAQEIEHYADMRMRSAKIKAAHTDIPLSLGVLNRPGKCRMVTMKRDIERMVVVKKALGNDCQLMLDANAIWSHPDVLAVEKEYDKLGIHSLEEPVRTDDCGGSTRLAADPVTKITGYETECLATNYIRMIWMRVMNMVQPDPGWCGGIIQTRKVVAIAGANFMEYTTHIWFSGILLATSMHFTCTILSGVATECDLNDNIFRGGLSEEPLRPDSSGVIALSDAPGLGVELEEEIIEKRRIQPF